MMLASLIAAAPMAFAQTIPNPSFETNAVFTNPPGYVYGNTAISGWTTNRTDRVGLNPGIFGASGNTPFADNGDIPNGARVAFIHSHDGEVTSLSTTITGLTAGTWYRVQFRTNQPGGSYVAPEFATCTVNGVLETLIPANPPVGGANAYHTFRADFQATATTAPLLIRLKSPIPPSDSALLLDDFKITAATPIVVTKTTDDNSTGTLRKALADAASGANAAIFNVITFAAGLNGGTITLNNEIVINDTLFVVIDASSLANGVTISGGAGTNRIFYVPAGNSLQLRRLKLVNGNGTGASQPNVGGAICSAGDTLSLIQCTLSNNSASSGGGAIHASGKLSMSQCTVSGNSSGTGKGGALSLDSNSASLDRCTLAGNTAQVGGGAIEVQTSTLTLTHCTISGNSSDGNGRAILNEAGVINCTNSIIFGNTGAAASEIDNSVGGSAFFRNGANVLGSLDNGVGGFDTGIPPITADPQLSALADNGGPTQTMAIAATGSAHNATMLSSITADQRGFPIIGKQDIGAFEAPAGGTFSLSATTYQAFEGGVAEIVITRNDNLSGVATVRLFTTPGAGATGATAPADFTARANTTASDVTFLDGEASKIVSIPLVADNLTEGDHTFTVSLGSPTPAGATITAPITATVTIKDAIGVTTTADQFDTPSGAQVSLREALRDAASHAGPDVIGFASTLSSSTLILTGGEITVADTGGVTIDGSSRGGVTLSGNQERRVFTVSGGGNLTLRRLTLTGGNGKGTASPSFGGAILKDVSGTVSLIQCTLTQNSATNGGAIYHAGGTGSVSLTKCTLSNNTADRGGAIYSFTTPADTANGTSLDRCTLAGNIAITSGGGIHNESGVTTIVHCTIAFNTAPEDQGSGVASHGENSTETIVEKSIIGGNTNSDADFVDSPIGSPFNSFTSAGANVIGRSSLFAPAFLDFNQPGDVFNVVNLRLTPLADNGGPTQTCAQLSSSPARDRATGSTITSDQRDFKIVGPADSGAYEAPASITNPINSPIVVTNTSDDGPGSLRQALRTAAANFGSDVINFSASLNGQTITLSSAIVVDDSGGVLVDALSLPKGITLDAGPSGQRVFTVGGNFLINTTATLRCLTLTGGHATGAGIEGQGGAICLQTGFLTVERCALMGNTAVEGGAIFSEGGNLNVNRCTVSNNVATADGGGIYIFSGSPTIRNCTVTQNTAGGDGGGLYVEFGNPALISSIVYGNSAPTSLPSNDIFIDGPGILAATTTNFSTTPDGPGIVSGTGINTADPLLGPLADNGGPTRTYALLGGSPAIDASTTSALPTDQRGMPIVKTADVGAYEAQLGATFTLSATGYSVNEGAPVPIVINRRDTQGTASVRLFTTVGTAGASDFTGRQNLAGTTPPGSEVFFDVGVGQVTVNIQTTPEGTNVVEANEAFAVTLGSPSVGATIGTPSSATVAIVDPTSGVGAGDLTKPTVSVAAPAAAASLNVDVGGSVTITGTATDNKGVSDVSLVINSLAGGAGTLEKPGATSTNFTFVVPASLLVSGLNQFQVTAKDGNNNTIVSATRTFKILRPLLVGISGGGGSVTAGFAPKSYRLVGSPLTVTATPPTGYLFNGWTVTSSHTLLQLGTSAAALDQSSITFIHRDGLSLVAKFAPNPYTLANTGTFNGGITPSPTLPASGGSGPGGVGTASGLDTEGYISMLVQPTGAFSGTMKIDSMTLNLAGTFDPSGVARFGTSRAKTISVARTGKPSLNVSLTMELAPSVPGANKITGAVSQFDQGSRVAASNVSADRAFFSATNPVPAAAFNATPLSNPARPATGSYTWASLVSSFNGLTIDQVPRGYGNGTVTLSTAGAITVVGKLPDGTAVTHSTTVSKTGQWRLFAQLYSGMKGLVAQTFVFDHSQTTTDFSAAADGWWICPVQDRQHYPLGWPGGIRLQTLGSKFAIPTGQSVIPLTQAIGTPDGNADLEVIDANLAPSLSFHVDISPADAVTKKSAGTYSLVITRATGAISGTVPHSDGTTVPFSGVVMQKTAGTLGFAAYGYSLTNIPAPKDYTGVSRGVRIKPQ